MAPKGPPNKQAKSDDQIAQPLVLTTASSSSKAKARVEDNEGAKSKEKVDITEAGDDFDMLTESQVFGDDSDEEAEAVTPMAKSKVEEA